MSWLALGLVLIEFLPLAIAWLVSLKAPNDFAILLFLLALLAYRQWRQRQQETDYELKIMPVARGASRCGLRLTR